MRKMPLLLAFALGAAPLLAHAGDAKGVWQSEPNDEGSYIHVEVAPCASDAGKLCGTIIDARNADPAKTDTKRRDELVGKVMINDMSPDGTNEWDGGTIWAPDDEETYSSKMELNGDVLTVSGCVLGGLICRGQEWKRVR